MEGFHIKTLADTLRSITKEGSSLEEATLTLLASIATSLATIADAVTDPEDADENSQY